MNTLERYKYRTPYSVEIRTYVPGGSYKWIWMRDCPNIQELNKTYIMLMTSRMSKDDFRAIKNEANLVT
jgi:hypothetical protein